jgi:hypothetical protein
MKAREYGDGLFKGLLRHIPEDNYENAQSW